MRTPRPKDKDNTIWTLVGECEYYIILCLAGYSRPEARARMFNALPPLILSYFSALPPLVLVLSYYNYFWSRHSALGIINSYNLVKIFFWSRFSLLLITLITSFVVIQRLLNMYDRHKQIFWRMQKN
jgi:hypothetical protein